MRSVTGIREQGGPRLKARRGALVMLVGLTCIALVAIAAMTIDISRLGVLSAELQNSADAGAHAGVVELNNGSTAAVALDSARAYAQRNTALQLTPIIEALETGRWNAITQQFTAGALPPNAVRVRVNLQPNGLIMGIVGIAPPLVHAYAIASIATFGSPPAPHPVIVR